MYKRDLGRWFKHLDFIILDLICLQLSYILAYGLASNDFRVYSHVLYLNIAVFMTLVDMISIFAASTMHDVIKRGYYHEFLATANHVIVVIASTIVALFSFKMGQSFSRLTLGLTGVLYLMISYAVRVLWKKHLRESKTTKHSLFIITSDDIGEKAVANMQEHNYAHFDLSGAAVINEDRIGSQLNGVPVVANADTVVDYVCQHWVDEILIVISDALPYPAELIDKLVETGIVVHYKLTKIENTPGRKQLVEKVGNYTVLTTTVNYSSNRQLAVKRMMDIAGSLVGCLLTGIIFIFVAPAIYLASPGPIFYTHERVGLNGKKFKMYKFRSMYLDADKRKAELMKQNKIADGKMFKMDFDPRIIGNRILPDGTRKTGIGEFIRKTSLDEFPQFFNVLKGDMSIVGTRPPLPSETMLYEPHHHVRLAVKPGITGMWQVSGRSNITDFEEVVRLDKEYIENWSIGLDIKIILKTILVVFKREGSM